MNSRAPNWAFACLIAVIMAALPQRISIAANTPAATSVVERLHGALYDAMRRADELGVKGRYQLLEPVVVSSFDFTKMVRIMSGGAWRDTDADTRARLVDAFSRFSVGTYASQFDGYSGQTFVTEREEKGPGATILVHTRIDSPGKPGVALVYVVHNKAHEWRIIDVLADAGISELARRRSEYRAVIKRDQISGLIDLLNRKTSQLVTP